MTPQQRFLLLLAAYGVVLLSLLVQGGLPSPVTRIFKIETPA
jgi:NhaP-type Na+/H+ or K+/H+ antiporter